MKTSLRPFTLLLCIAAVVPLMRAADPEVKKDLRVVAGPGDNRQKTPVTFLGVEAVPVSPALTDQLGLAPDMGLVVNTIAPDSPATAVLKRHDILMKLDDQKLIDPQQLMVLIRGHKEGDEVTLTYIRGGKEATAKVKLATRTVEDLHLGSWESGGPFDQPWQNFIPNDWQHLRALPHTSGVGNTTYSNEINNVLPMLDLGRGMHTQVIHIGPGNAEGQDLTTVNTSNSNLVLSDDAGTLEVKVVDGKKNVVAKNTKGEVLFSGPFNTEAERKAAPPEVRQRLDKLERMEGVRFKADADFHPGESDLAVPSPHRIIYRQIPNSPLPPPSLML